MSKSLASTMYSAPYMLFQPNQRIKVISSAHAPRESEAGRHGRFIEYTSHGFARVDLDPKPEWKDRSGDRWLIHPENLVSECLCSEYGCGFYANDMSDYCAHHG